MRVALLSYNARAGDAIGNQVAEKLAFFLDQGAHVLVLVEDDRHLHPAVRPHARALRSPEPAGEAWRFLASADLVVVEFGQAYRLLDLLPLLAGGRPRILFDYHGVTPADLWGDHNREALEQGSRQRGLAWCADLALAHSRFTLRELRDHTGLPADRLRQLGHPLDLDHFRPGPPTRSLRDELGLGTAPLLLFVGRLAVNKRVPVLIEALAQLQGPQPPHLALVGACDDLYQHEKARCQERAAALGLAGRVHFLGPVGDAQLRDAYRSADVFVMPSRHEGFCIPALEAMAYGVPVVAARAGALPETLGPAGLTFTPDDAADLARQLRRVLATLPGAAAAPAAGRAEETPDRLRVAVVACRYGADLAGGAERSLRTMAHALHQAGHAVEVFTTCTRTESDWTNQVPEGTTRDEGIPVHHFRIDPHDRVHHAEAFRAIQEAGGPVADATEQAYLAHSLHASRLLDALRRRHEAFDAFLVGPYLFGLTHDVARAFPERTLVVPCFHDEPLARLRAWRETYAAVGGLLYHSPEEQTFAEAELGLNHPGAACVGTWLDTTLAGDAARGQAEAGGRRYLVYCGRYSPQKNVPLLLEYARRYAQEHPGRFGVVFAGQGPVAIPREPWAHDAGFVTEERKRDLLAGASALVQLSAYESLSLTALEAWAVGTPVLAHAGCAVLAAQVERAGGGQVVATYEEFAAALDDLWQRPDAWRQRGQQGQAFVQQTYGCRATFLQRLVDALHDRGTPLGERLRRQGLRRAAAFGRPGWRERFGRLVEDLLDAPPRPCAERLEVRPRGRQRRAAAGAGTVLVPVRVVNRGTYPAVAEGPARVVLRAEVVDGAGRGVVGEAAAVPLPGLLLPGRALTAAVPVAVPAQPGSYQVRLVAGRAVPVGRGQAGADDPEACLELLVEGSGSAAAGCCTPLLDSARAALAEAEERHRLPDDYTDVTEGLFASWKRRIKAKLLGNFKRAYVDVLARQQSAVNRQLLTALHELAETCALLDQAHAAGRAEPAALAGQVAQALAAGKTDDLAVLVQRVAQGWAESRRHVAALEERLARLEERLNPREEVPS